MIAYIGGGLIGAGTVSGFMVALPAIVIVAAIALGFALLAIAVELLERAGRIGEPEQPPLGHPRLGIDRSRRTR